MSFRTESEQDFYDEQNEKLQKNFIDVCRQLENSVARPVFEITVGKLTKWKSCADVLAEAVRNPDGSGFWSERELKALALYEKLKTEETEP